MRQDELYAGRYRIGRELGRGGMGVVSVAHDVNLGRDVALKVMRPSARQDPAAAGRFSREARALAAVDHPGVVTVHDYGEADGELFLVMQLVEGGDLESRLSGHRRLTPARTVELADGIAAALDALHARGLVHRDVKPSNVLLAGDQQRPVLCDFGLAKPTDLSDGLTGTGETVGTVQYMAPEQLAGDPATASSDVYAFGCVLFHCLSGRPPFTGADAWEVATAHRSDPVPDVRAFVPGVPAQVQPVLERCLAKEPAQRWRTAGEAAQALRSALTEPATVGVERPTSRLAAPLPESDRESAWDEWEPEPEPEEPSRGSGAPRELVAGCAALVLAAAVVGGVLGLTSGTGGDQEVLAAPRAAQGVVLDADHQSLADLLAEGYGECSPLDRLPGQVAKLNCDATPEGISTLHAVQWQDTATMSASFRELYVDSGRYTTAPCGDFAGGPGSQGTGHVSTWPEVGSIACYVNVNEHAVLLWQVDDRAVQLLAIREDPDAPAVFDWWQASRDDVLRPAA